MNDTQPGNRELWAVVPAAGQGTRLPSAYPKQYLELKGRCLLQRAVDTLLELPDISGVVVVLSEADSLWSKLPASGYQNVLTTIGGASRAESVMAGLKKVCNASSGDNAMVLVHDAARAMTAKEDIVRLIERVGRAPEQGGLLASKVQDTLKRADVSEDVSGSNASIISETVSRSNLWHAQTPQMFQASVLLQCLVKNKAAIDAGEITDEACVMERSGFKPALVEAIQPNFKITHARDFDMALALMELRESNSQSMMNENS